MPEINKPVKKVFVVGDGGCGKTSLLYRYSQNGFTTNYISTVFEIIPVDIRDANANVYLSLQIWDNAGQEDYERIRVLSYPDTDIVLMCFSVVDKKSFRHVSEKWIEEINHFCKNVPILLVGLKADLRTDTNTETSVSIEKAQAASKAIGAVRYVECSAHDGKNVEEVFRLVLDVLLGKKGKKKKKSARICSHT
jgi:small GTP-binding protein